ncbi:hypothetical protein [Ectobacillus ponti]|uniref:Uncharacterized protein n=1 Tax=Ectobacillus ponti TaxID=2961894 RepID=A0AA41X8K4_9BACI|nr:hypothetical protein [Ectobacillus ponti]MCP8969123.1 hypothetical protein [Ectobacillus ponti]
MKYTIFSVSEGFIADFSSDWLFRTGEVLFFCEEERKRNFVVTRVTHDVSHAGEHIVRLYCTEKKVHTGEEEAIPE